MLSECKVGDCIMYEPNSHKKYIGIVLEEPTKKNFSYNLLFKVTILNDKEYTKAEDYLNGYWFMDNKFISPYKPTIEEIFKIKQIQEKEQTCNIY